METNDIPDTEVSDWVPMSNPLHLALLGKSGEELGELISAKDRCIIQGLDGIDPDSGKVNKDWLADEVADVEAMLMHIKEWFNLDSHAINERRERKYAYKGKWFDKLQRDLDRNIAVVKSNMFSKCLAIQYSDTTVCSACNLRWDTNDTAPPACPRMETKERLMGGLADTVNEAVDVHAPLQREINYVMLLDYPVETIKLMAEQNPNLYIVPFYIRMYGAMRKASDVMEDADAWGGIRNVFKPQLLALFKWSPIGSWKDLARPVVENLFSGLGTLKEMRDPPLVQFSTEQELPAFEYMIAVDQSREALTQLAYEHPDVYIVTFHTNKGRGSVPKSQYVMRGSMSDEQFLDELRKIARNRFVGDKVHIRLVEAVFPVLPSKPTEAPEMVEWYVGNYVGFNRVRFKYTNHLGVRAQREVRPIKVWFGATPYHSTSRFLLKAYDYDRQGERDFEMGQMHEVHYIGASENMRG